MIIKIKDYDINYIDEGTGDAVLLLHGWGANLKCFAQLIGTLKVKYRVFAIDYPGFGESGNLRESFRVDDYADIVVEFLKKMNVDKVILVGHSYGGRIIIKLNSRDNLPFTIEKNVLIDAAGIKNKQDLMSKVKITTFKTLKKIANALPISDDKKNEYENILKAKFGSKDYASAPKILQETLVKSVNEDLTDLLKNMRETLIIWGDNDTVTPMWMAKKMESIINNSGLVILKGGHFSFIDDQNTFLRVMESYLKI